MAHLNRIDVKACEAPRTWTTTEIIVVAIMALLLGMVIGAQAVKRESMRDTPRIQASALDGISGVLKVCTPYITIERQTTRRREECITPSTQYKIHGSFRRPTPCG
jgi:hypothetical protein